MSPLRPLARIQGRSCGAASDSMIQPTTTLYVQARLLAHNQAPALFFAGPEFFDGGGFGRVFVRRVDDAEEMIARPHERGIATAGVSRLSVGRQACDGAAAWGNCLQRSLPLYKPPPGHHWDTRGAIHGYHCIISGMALLRWRPERRARPPGRPPREET